MASCGPPCLLKDKTSGKKIAPAVKRILGPRERQTNLRLDIFEPPGHTKLLHPEH